MHRVRVSTTLTDFCVVIESAMLSITTDTDLIKNGITYINRISAVSAGLFASHPVEIFPMHFEHAH